ncbi:hypothetical protein FGO68_gene2935 [Halteria grandinella]|uniref:non-specific serine/threonine protein kinase n=1 Tax=Halteria grandinella TaxID=5974 RepID=A0A8J8NFZ3_HALGN|nr:hypothetical protein FGO68_gene2935 [Halteria grandinella]
MRAMNYEIPEIVALNWFTHACLGLARMHSKGLAHRDVKPANILIVGGCGGVAKLGDFGTVKRIDTYNHLTMNIGTYSYYAPEIITKKYSVQVDVWAIGIVLFEMLSRGDFPFAYNFNTGNPFDYLVKLQNLELKQMSHRISPQCQALIKWLLRKNPNKRPSIFEVLQTPIIAERIKSIVDKQNYGSKVSIRIKQQLQDLKISIHPSNYQQIGVKNDLSYFNHQNPKSSFFSESRIRASNQYAPIPLRSQYAKCQWCKRQNSFSVKANKCYMCHFQLKDHFDINAQQNYQYEKQDPPEPKATLCKQCNRNYCTFRETEFCVSCYNSNYLKMISPTKYGKHQLADEEQFRDVKSKIRSKSIQDVKIDQRVGLQNQKYNDLEIECKNCRAINLVSRPQPGQIILGFRCFRCSRSNYLKDNF